MDLYTFFVWALILALVVLGVWFLYTVFIPTKEEKEHRRIQKESLEDDRVYDPETGRFFTLEELENDERFEATKGNDLYTEEEIEKVFSYDASFPLIHNFLIENGYLTTNDDETLSRFRETAMANSYDGIRFARTYAISSKSALSLMELEYKVNGSYHSDLYFIGNTSLKEGRGHFLLEPVSIKEGLLRFIDTTKSKIIDGWNLVPVNNELDGVIVDDIIMALPKNKWLNDQLVDESENVKVAIEVKENQLYFKSSSPIKEEELDGMISILRNLEKL